MCESERRLIIASFLIVLDYILLTVLIFPLLSDSDIPSSVREREAARRVAADHRERVDLVHSARVYKREASVYKTEARMHKREARVYMR